MKFKNGGKLQFCNSSPRAVFLKENDTLSIVDLKNRIVSNVGVVQNHQLIQANNRDILIYSIKGSNKIIIKAIVDNHAITIQNPEKEFVNEEWGTIAVTAKKGTPYSLFLIDIETIKQIRLWEGKEVVDVLQDSNCSHLAFAEQIADGNYKIWYTNKSYRAPEVIFNTQSLKFVDDTLLSKKINIRFQGFSDNEDMLFIELSQYTDIEEEPASPVTVWRYNDDYLPTESPKTLKQVKHFYAIDIKTGHAFLILNSQDKLIGSYLNTNCNNEYFLVENENGNPKGIDFGLPYTQSIYLVSKFNGNRLLVRKNVGKKLKDVYLSPSGDYVIYYDPSEKQYFSWQRRNGKTVMLTRSVNADWSKYSARDYVSPQNHPAGCIGWYEDKYILINDRYNIWKIDYSAKKNAENLTAVANKDSLFIFSIAFEKKSKLYNEGDKLILSAFNIKTKDEGFYRLDFNPAPFMNELVMGPHRYGNSGLLYHTKTVAKSSNGKYFIIMKENSESFPNLYLTSDFKTYSHLTNYQPQNEFNWYSSELHHWSDSSGNSYQGVLYKPENFDPQRKYPVILHFYEKMSDDLNRFHMPVHSTGVIEIPFLTSNGYLVFTPDIEFKTGEPGKSFLNSVTSAATYLSQYQYVEDTMMGLQGHSFGGYGTNYIIAHTSIFKAALSAAGVSNFSSEYGMASEKSYQNSKINQFENGQYRMGGTLGGNVEGYIRNSPIFNITNIRTPLLIMHNRLDENVSFSQSLNLFNSLRRLQKPVWMLEYKNETHGLLNQQSQKDYEQKALDFFNCFLKNQPIPDWLMPH